MQAEWASGKNCANCWHVRSRTPAAIDRRYNPVMSEEVSTLVVGGGSRRRIARDAAAEAFSHAVERDDLGEHTSSSSSKLSMAACVISNSTNSPLPSRLRARSRSSRLRTWCAHACFHAARAELRPAWMIRAGLFLYDYLARRQTLPGSHRVDLAHPPYDAGLKPGLRTGFIYSDCRVDDARLVVANARAAADAGAVILSRTACVGARREDGMWRATLASAQGAQSMVRARGLINVAGPWAKQFLT